MVQYEFFLSLNNKTIYQQMVNVKTTLFCVKNLIIKLKKDKKELGFEPQIFSNFPAHDLNFLKGENDEIKSRRGS